MFLGKWHLWGDLNVEEKIYNAGIRCRRDHLIFFPVLYLRYSFAFACSLDVLKCSMTSLNSTRNSLPPSLSHFLTMQGENLSIQNESLRGEICHSLLTNFGYAYRLDPDNGTPEERDCWMEHCKKHQPVRTLVSTRVFRSVTYLWIEMRAMCSL